MSKKIKVAVLSAFALNGKIVSAGTSAKPNEVMVDVKLAKNLLRREKVKLAEGVSIDAAEDDGDDEPDTGKRQRRAAPVKTEKLAD